MNKVNNLEENHQKRKCVLTAQDVSPVWILLCIVTTKAQIKVFADVAVDPAAYNEPLAVVTGVFHVYHLMVILVALGLGTTLVKTQQHIGFFFPMRLSSLTTSDCVLAH